MPRTGLSRRQLLKLGVTAAGATLVPTGSPSGPLRAAAATGDDDVDHARAAQQAYRESLSRLRRSVPDAAAKPAQSEISLAIPGGAIGMVRLESSTAVCVMPAGLNTCSFR